MRTLQSASMHDLPSPFDVFSAAPEPRFTIEHAKGARTFVNQVAKDFQIGAPQYRGAHGNEVLVDKALWSELFDLVQDQYILRTNLPVTNTVRGLLMRAVDEYIAECGV